jgi:hypothetical protein
VFNDRVRPRGGEALAVDVEQTLTDLERQLDALEADLGGQILQSSTPASADRECAIARSDPSLGHRILLEALVDIHALSAFERALVESPRVRTVALRAYAGGWASLLVDVS